MTTTYKGMSRAALIKALEEAKATGGKRPLTMKVGEKKGVSVYGLNAQFPVTLYAAQWERLIEFAPKITEFIAANESSLSRK